MSATPRIPTISEPAAPPRTAAGRLLALLDAFAPGRSALTLSEISRRAGLSLTTTHRLAAELTSWGALERDRSGRYRPGLRLLELAALAPRGLELREVAQPFLEDLCHATRANVHLAVRDGNEVVYVETLRARGAVHVLSRLGGRWPLHATGTGLVLLAHAGFEAQERVLASELVRFTPRTVVDPGELRRVLAGVRRTGIALAEGQITPDALAVAAPVRAPGGEVIAALGVVVRAGHGGTSALVPAVTSAARGIADALRS